MGKISFELLWTNDSPTTSFAAKDVAVDFSGYTHAAIIARRGSNASYTELLPPVLIPLDGTYGRLAFTYGSNNRKGCRDCYANGTGIHFTKATYNSSDNNTVLVPLYIYGVNGF